MAIATERLRPVNVKIDDEYLTVTLEDGRIISTPLVWYPLLEKATAAQRSDYELMSDGIHWPELDEDLSIAGMLAGRRAAAKMMLVREVARFFDIRPHAVYKAIQRDRLPAKKVGGTYKILGSDAALWRAETRMGRPPND